MQKTSKRNIGKVTIVDNVEENRLQIFFPEKPQMEVRIELKSHGFKWSNRNGCWQRYRSNNANYNAKNIICKYF